MLVVGSRGDVQPFLVLALALNRCGHRVRLATHSLFRDFVQGHGVEFFDLGGDPMELMAYMVANPGLMPRFEAWRKGEVIRKRRMMSEIVHASWRACFESTRRSAEKKKAKEGKLWNEKRRAAETELQPFVADAIIANPPSLAHVHCAEKMGVPLHIFFTMPWSPTSQLPHPLATIKTSSQKPSRVNAISYLLVESLILQGLGSMINNFRTKVLRLDPIHPSRAPSLLHSGRIPHTYLWSESVLPRPKDWPSNIGVTGFLPLEGTLKYSPPENLRKFLASDPPPVYVGFGSIVVADPVAFLTIVVDAVRSTRKRLILATGWSGGKGAGLDLEGQPDILVLTAECPHDWLFPQVSCVVHHGGAGTTASGLRAGRPTVIVPFFGDQHFWGDCVCEAGAGPPPIPHKQMTSETLAAAVYFASRPDVANRANEIGLRIRSENSVEKALILSAVAAAVLARKQLINMDDLELHRKCDLDIAHGPYEPASGAAWAITELLFDSLRGMGEILAEKEIPKRPSRGKDAIVARASSEQTVGPPSDTAKKALKFPGTYFVDGSLRIGKAAVRAPGDFTLAMAYGAHDLPRFGLAAGCEGLFWGVADGISGLFVQPVAGLVKDGPVGMAKGAASGILGLPVKFFAAANAIVGYPLKGIDLAVSGAFATDGVAAIKLQTKIQGERELRSLAEQSKQLIVHRWQDFVIQRAQT
ncbi:Sterol 3-beta-glucosyltransferase UGT80B1 [Cyphellophora attinorum]|uniref:Sterol 3-beta-glucosyltransferase UGT80B1 n=1 Tax=Cyphellophora attinorum TaxID=1664694 RepID=A0A0N1GXA7_9EURO|nr:Sterol 3-beta-glucosyltransferase UGT80B1 [Phialophora attinorum]KPI34755.1 Sterol 3-beta-glucosyltransferase UGT80B1 [Phialophora attinorum]